MIIARSSCSDLSVSGGNSLGRSLGERVCKPQRKRIRFGLVTLYLAVANLPKWVKPVTSIQATSICGWEAVRGGWEQRADKDSIRNLGDPSGWFQYQRFNQMHKVGIGPARKSDAPIVVMKLVKVSGAKGCCCGQSTNNEGSSA